MALKLLVFTFYYPPDLCAGSFRSKALVEQLQAELGDAAEIDVITTLPNRYATFAADAPLFESQPGLSITRVPLPAHQSGMLDQAKAFVTYARAATKQARKKEYDLVFATSSRLMTAVLGSWVSRRKNLPLYLDIRDIFVDTIGDVLPAKLARLTKPVFAQLEKWSFSRATRINLVSKGFASYFQGRYPNVALRWFSNGIDAEFITDAEYQVNTNIDPCPQRDDKINVLYAGNIGEGQGLHTIIPALAKRLEGRVRFEIIGDGGRLTKLRESLTELDCTNVSLIAPKGREDLIKAYQQADVLFVHLNDYPAFKKVLPSKLFEYAAMGKPIWAGLAGYSASFVQDEIRDAAVFYPCDVEGALHAFASLTLGQSNRSDFIANYARQDIMKAMAKDMSELVC